MSGSNNGINISGNQGDVIGVGIKGDDNVVGKNISIGGDINVNKNKYENLAPEFKNSLDDFLAYNKQKKRAAIRRTKKVHVRNHR